ncbi:spindle pole body interacting protein, partial [Rhizodiscina lignyota]
QVRSQYPRDSMENHVEYILVASFDIDRGSVMEHQYPGPISGDETMLAELMLPDQAHMRSLDWTIFFLHKDTSAEEEAKELRRERRRRRRRKGGDGEGDEDGNDLGRPSLDDEGDDYADASEDETEEDDDELEGPPLVYVLNLVNTKQDNTVKRGAIVKAMAICTRHSFLHIYKPLLLLALEEYFRNPVPDTLALLYDAVNSMDLSLMPRLSLLERQILQASDAKDMFIEKFDQMIQHRMVEDAQRSSEHSSTSDSPSRKALTRYNLPRDTHEFESRVMYNGIPVPIKIPSAISPETVGDFSLVKLIQTFSAPHSQSPQAFSPSHPHLTTSGPYTHPVIVLINALLTQKRIVFLGHNQPSGSVAEAVLAACALASGGGVLRGFTRHAFPYTDLTKIDDLLKVPGFIAGVTNPAFAHKPEWWDVLCDLPTGRIKISPKIEGAPVTEGLLFFQQSNVPLTLNGAAGTSEKTSDKAALNRAIEDVTGDHAFMESVHHSISSRHGENVIRSKFGAYIQRFTRIAAAFEECVYGASALFIGANETDTDKWNYGVSGHGYVWRSEAERAAVLGGYAWRVEGWRSTRSYYSFVGDLARGWDKANKQASVGLDLRFQCDRLRCLKMGHDQSAAIYLALARSIERAGAESDDASTSAEDDSPASVSGSADPATAARNAAREMARYDIINQLLVVLPESSGGLFHIALGLFHPRQDVRAAVVGLLERIREHPAGRHFWANMGRFAKTGFWRVR